MLRASIPATPRKMHLPVRGAIGVVGEMRPVRFREEIDEYLKKWENTVDR